MVKEIQLTQNQVSIVDDEDFDFLNQWKWQAMFDPCTRGYYARRSKNLGIIDGKRRWKAFPMHRVIMERMLGRKLKSGEIVDHINHNTLKNTRNNIRVVSSRQNCQNHTRKTSSKYPGVSWNKRLKKWEASIKINRKKKHLGFFKNEKKAARVYERACRELVGEELVCKIEGGP